LSTQNYLANGSSVVLSVSLLSRFQACFLLARDGHLGENLTNVTEDTSAQGDHFGIRFVERSIRKKKRERILSHPMLPIVIK